MCVRDQVGHGVGLLGPGLEDQGARRHQTFWHGLRRLLPVWDDMITEFNDRVAAG